jgi:anti-sigma regulatory factor (Ser/Thr protein kinase)
MRSGAARDHQGYFHETAFYDTDEEFLAIVAPFFAEGLAAGEPAVSAFGPHNQALIRDVFGDQEGITFIGGDLQYARPASAIHRYRRMLADYVAAGAQQIRVAGDVPHPGVGVPWDWWARYEAAVNHAYNDFPLWGMCPYDTRTTPTDVIDQVRRTHPHIASPGGHHINPEFEDPQVFLSGHAGHWRDPLEGTPPAIEFTDPLPADVREAVTRFAAGTALSVDEVQGLLLAATEAVSNAAIHGAPPVQVRIWSAPRRIVVTVTDRGKGPNNPFAGLLPGQTPGEGGFGLWLAHQMCAYVTLEPGPDGFTIRLIAGLLNL